ncbi:MAG: DNA translocase FtsK 4TM domain-containing protein, partial [Bacteroidota bacterium]
MGAAGMVGGYTNAALDWLFGAGAYLSPLLCIFYVYALMKPREDERVSISKIIGIALLFISALGFLELYREDFGGMIGLIVKAPLMYLFGSIAAGVLLAALFMIGVLLTFNVGLQLPRFGGKSEEEMLEEDELLLPEDVINADEIEAEEAAADTDSEEEEPEEEKPQKKSMGERFGLAKSGEFAVSSFEGPYDPPPLSLLQKDKGKSKGGDVKANANIIKRTLKNFNIDVEMDEVSIGPSVTRYALKPAEGVRISKIVGLQNNLEMALAASPIRIEAPIPGKSLVGIEVPNTQKAMVGLSSLLSSPEFTDSSKPLLAALGKDITGNAHFT